MVLFKLDILNYRHWNPPKSLSENIVLSAGDVGALALDGTAAKATADAEGNNISQTYAKLADVISFEEM